MHLVAIDLSGMNLDYPGRLGYHQLGAIGTSGPYVPRFGVERFVCSGSPGPLPVRDERLAGARGEDRFLDILEGFDGGVPAVAPTPPCSDEEGQGSQAGVGSAHRGAGTRQDTPVPFRPQ